MTQNECHLAGYLGGTPVLRYLASGTPVVSMRLGQSYSYHDSQGKEQRKTNWFTVVGYGPIADIAKTYQTGDNVVVQGQLETRDWMGQDGSKRQVTEVIARNVARLERQAKNGAAAAEEPDRGGEVKGAEDDVEEWPAA